MRAGSEKGINAVIIDGGGPVIEQLDVILDGDPYPDYRYAHAPRLLDHWRIERRRA